ncbi:MAG: gamma-glutamylcyclotransferase [Rhodocyclaceae bacterium]|nr:gamma-glutamylcyclotransferase [Rhodocyclaceae bacterium]
MCADIFHAVSGQRLAGTPATLAGFARHPVRGESYPAIAPAPAAGVAGQLYRGLSAAALSRLDAFEGALYQRQRVTVVTPDDAPRTAWAYVIHPGQVARLADGDWDFAHFVTTARASFLRQLIHRAG